MPRIVSLAAFWIAVVLCVVGQAAIIRAAVAGRTPGTSARSSNRWLELAWVLLPAVVLLIVLAFTWRQVGGSGDTSAPPGTVI